MERTSGDATGPASSGAAADPTLAERLTEVFAQTLGIASQDVRPDESFFTQGGDSLLSIEASAAAEEQGIPMTLEMLYRCQSLRGVLADLAAAEEPARSAAADTSTAVTAFQLSDEDRALTAEGLEDAFPASALQQGMILHSSMYAGSTAYHDVALYRVGERLDPAAMRSAVVRTVAAHPTLRSSFDMDSYSEPLQLVHLAAEAESTAHDHRGLSGAELQDRYDRWVREEHARPFDIACPPLLRLALFDEGPAGFVLGVSFHHAILDGHSLARFVRLLLTAHHALATGERLPHASSAIPAQRQAAVLEQQAARSQEQLDWWRGYLHDFTPLRLPRSAQQHGRDGIGRLEQLLDPQVAERLRAVAHDLRLGIKHLTLGIHQWMVGQVTGRTDVTCGLIVNVRPQAVGSTDQLGLFLNTLPCRTSVSAASWQQLAQRALEAEAAVLAHRHVPYAVLRRELKPAQEPTEATFNYVRFRDLDALTAQTDVTVEPLMFYEEGNFPLSTYVVEDIASSAIAVQLHYDRGVIDDASAQRMMDLYVQGLDACASDPTAPCPPPDPAPGTLELLAGALDLDAAAVASVVAANATQRDLYLDYCREPDADRYCLAFTAELGPSLDLTAWQSAVAGVVAEHPALRTRFAALDDEPYFCALQPQHAPVEVAVPAPGARPGSLKDAISEARKPYRLERDPLVRHAVLHVDGQWHAVLGAHHLVLDVAGAQEVFADLFHAYARLTSPLPVDAAPEDSPQPAERPETEPAFDTPDTIEYWRQIADRTDALSVPPPFGAPLDRLDEATLREERVSIGGEPLLRLRRECERRGIGPSSILLAAFGLVLGRCFAPTGDFVVHRLQAGRTAVRRASGARYHVVPTVIPWSQRHQDGFAGQLPQTLHDRHRALGPRAFVSVLRQRRLFNEQTRFFYNHYPTRELDGPGGPVSLRVHEAYPRNEVHLIVEDHGDTVDLVLRAHAGDLPVQGLADRIARTVSAILPAGSAAAELHEVPLLSAAERDRVLHHWNDTTTPTPTTTVHDLVITQAHRTPDATAVRTPTTTLTYRQLLDDAHHLAATLQHHGARPGTTIGILAPRTPQLVTALLATLITGAAYTPLDPEYPANRLHHMIQTSHITTVLTHHNHPHITDHFTGTLIPIDTHHPHTPTPTTTHPQDLAYTIYTSGSTGTPKGAMNQHDGVVNRLLWMRDEFGVGADDAILQKTPMSFDVAVWEFFLPLISGAELVLAEPGGHRDPLYLVEAIRTERITTVHFVPSMLRYFLAAVSPGDLPSLRRIICSGEALPADLRDECHRKLPDVLLSNLYGPTEAAVDVTAWHCAPDETGSSVPIGSPIANTRTYVLDENLDPLPVGAAGELYLAGIQVGRGYYDRPSLSAERFLPDPYAPAPGARMYRTGDRARWRPDGNLDYLGRLDHQVKIRGQRIELGEIEAALRAQPGVSEAVVDVREAVAGHPQLFAYLTGDGSTDLSVPSLRAALADLLPSAMLPSRYTVLEAMPLNSNGKLDRRALPTPAPPRTARPAFANATESSIAGVWAEVLGRSDIAPNTNFFDAGGDSLLLLRVRGKLGRLLPAARGLSPVDLFEFPTISSLAAKLTGEARGDQSAEPDRASLRRALTARRRRPEGPHA
ncbi:amino acid adenylation domain-containing protein [Kitasatospora sp. GAS1066B]|uniref:amino acid adenylation domain-containing protein n=1 Tax=Kitasatospora sp. GAS1066B TaxID=3156271 RepID=UPI00351874F9